MDSPVEKMRLLVESEADPWLVLDVMRPPICPCGSPIFHSGHLNAYYDAVHAALRAK